MAKQNSRGSFVPAILLGLFLFACYALTRPQYAKQPSSEPAIATSDAATIAARMQPALEYATNWANAIETQRRQPQTGNHSVEASTSRAPSLQPASTPTLNYWSQKLRDSTGTLIAVETQSAEQTRLAPPPVAKPTTAPLFTGCPNGCTTHIAGCDIKGNISYSTGEKNYHVLGGQYYASTVINPAYGERWFCTEAEARANGWRRSLK